MGVVRSRPVMPSAATAKLLAAPAIGLSLALAGLATVNPHVGTAVTHEMLPMRIGSGQPVPGPAQVAVPGATVSASVSPDSPGFTGTVHP
jgi:hypothetical protein